MNADFTDLTAVITRSAQGIGKEIAEVFQARGAKLILVDCNAACLSATGDSLRRNGRFVECFVADLADPSAVASLRSRISAVSPPVDVLVNNAGVEFDRSFEEVTWSE